MNPVQWSADHLLAQLASVKAKAKAEWDELGRNSERVTALYADADRIGDPQRRQAIRRGLEAWASRQAKLQSDFNAAYGKFRAAYNGVAAFMRSIGAQAPPDTGLGVVPSVIIVPAVVAGLVITAGLWFAAIHEKNLTQRAGLANQAALIGELRAGHLTPEQFLGASKDAAAEANARDRDNNLVGDIGGVLLPALLLVGAIVIVPKLIGRKAAA